MCGRLFRGCAPQSKEEYGLVSRGSVADLMVDAVDNWCAAAFYRLCVKFSDPSYLTVALQHDTSVHLCMLPACLTKRRTPSGLASRLEPIYTSQAEESGTSTTLHVVHVSGNDCLFMSACYDAGSPGAHCPAWTAL